MSPLWYAICFVVGTGSFALWQQSIQAGFWMGVMLLFAAELICQVSRSR